jgi:hypothetical protein
MAASRVGGRQRLAVVTFTAEDGDVHWSAEFGVRSAELE